MFARILSSDLRSPAIPRITSYRALKTLQKVPPHDSFLSRRRIAVLSFKSRFSFDPLTNHHHSVSPKRLTPANRIILIIFDKNMMKPEQILRRWFAGRGRQSKKKQRIITRQITAIVGRGRTENTAHLPLSQLPLSPETSWLARWSSRPDAGVVQSHLSGAVDSCGLDIGTALFHLGFLSRKGRERHTRWSKTVVFGETSHSRRISHLWTPSSCLPRVEVLDVEALIRGEGEVCDSC